MESDFYNRQKLGLGWKELFASLQNERLKKGNFIQDKRESLISLRAVMKVNSQTQTRAIEVGLSILLPPPFSHVFMILSLRRRASFHSSSFLGVDK
jgi:hypothetical protein